MRKTNLGYRLAVGLTGLLLLGGCASGQAASEAKIASGEQAVEATLQTEENPEAQKETVSDGIAQTQEDPDRTIPVWAELQIDHEIELHYADQFQVTFYEQDYDLITIDGTGRYLLVPEGGEVPAGLDADITVFQKPLQKLYIASSSSMDPILRVGGLECAAFTSTNAASWTIPEIAEAVTQGSLTYVGKYSAPDYELLTAEGCDGVVENTMIYHSPETKEKLESLGMPVMVEHSSFESHPLGRLEWIRLYGVLLDREEEADRFFAEKEEAVLRVLKETDSGKTASFFNLIESGGVMVRKPSDYIATMMELAGGRYALADMDMGEDAGSATATTTIQMEAFYDAAADADYMIYNGLMEQDTLTLEEILEKDSVLGDFKAVKEGNVWGTRATIFQQSTGAADLILDFHALFNGEADDQEELNFLYRVH